jgi:hypothetical protein
MINRLKTPAQVDICKDRWDRNPKKDSKRPARDEEHSAGNEECLPQASQ